MRAHSATRQLWDPKRVVTQRTVSTPPWGGSPLGAGLVLAPRLPRASSSNWVSVHAVEGLAQQVPACMLCQGPKDAHVFNAAF